MKLYIKTLDQGRPQPEYVLRTELSLDGVSLEWAGVETLANLPKLGAQLRSDCAKAFRVGKGFQTDDAGGTTWKKFGASWDINGTKGLGLTPDSAINEAFGAAIGSLGRKLQRLAAGSTE